MDKKTEIRDAAQTLFAQFGLRKVTTDDISRHAHISKATIYRYYKNKSVIFEDVVQMEFDQLLTLVRDAVNKETTVKGKFRAHLRTKMNQLQELINFYRVTQKSWGDYWPHIEGIRKRFMAEEKKIVSDVLRLGNRNGELDVRDIDLAAHIMVVGLKSMEFPWAIEGQNIKLEEYIDMMLELMLDGLRKRNGQSS